MCLVVALLPCEVASVDEQMCGQLALQLSGCFTSLFEGKVDLLGFACDCLDKCDGTTTFTFDIPRIKNLKTSQSTEVGLDRFFFIVEQNEREIAPQHTTTKNEIRLGICKMSLFQSERKGRKALPPKEKEELNSNNTV